MVEPFLVLRKFNAQSTRTLIKWQAFNIFSKIFDERTLQRGQGYKWVLSWCFKYSIGSLVYITCTSLKYTIFSWLNAMPRINAGFKLASCLSLHTLQSTKYGIVCVRFFDWRQIWWHFGLCLVDVFANVLLNFALVYWVKKKWGCQSVEKYPCLINARFK